jgi:RHS repeat-associated protein
MSARFSLVPTNSVTTRLECTQSWSAANTGWSFMTIIATTGYCSGFPKMYAIMRTLNRFPFKPGIRSLKERSPGFSYASRTYRTTSGRRSPFKRLKSRIFRFDLIPASLKATSGKPGTKVRLRANTSNQLSCTAGCTTSYDTAGNTTTDGNGAITYDAENRITSTNGVTYTYDGDGKRVEKSSGTLFWTGVGSDPLSESDLSGNINEEYVFFNGMRVSRIDRPSNTVHAFLADHLGSSRMSVVPSGTNTLTVEEDLDYTPYGIVASGTASDHYQFTGKIRDSESGLDNFGARYNASIIGRFMTPDWAAKPTNVPYAKFGDPQTLNLYSFTENGPINRIDPDGHEDEAGGAESSESSGPGQADTKQPPATQSTLLAQNAEPEVGGVPESLRNEKTDEIDPNAEAERALEPVEPEPVTPAAEMPGQSVLNQHSASDVEAVRNGACSVDPDLAPAIRQNDLFNTIANGGFKVTANPKTAEQEANITITSPLQPGVKLNLRVETHSRTPGGPPVRHVNVELVTPRTATEAKTIINRHIDR